MVVDVLPADTESLPCPSHDVQERMSTAATSRKVIVLMNFLISVRYFSSVFLLFLPSTNCGIQDVMAVSILLRRLLMLQIYVIFVKT